MTNGPFLFGDTQDGGFEQRVEAIVQRVLAEPTSLPVEFKTWSADYGALNLPYVPIGQVFGFTAFTARASTPVTTSDSMSNSTYDDLLVTVGPRLSGLLDGSYIFVFGATATPGSSTAVRMSLQYDSTAAVDANSIVWGTASAPGAIAVAATLSSAASSNNHTVTAKYRSDGTNSASWQNRWLIGLRYASA